MNYNLNCSDLELSQSEIEDCVFVFTLCVVVCVVVCAAVCVAVCVTVSVAVCVAV